ncbi:MAG: hypothetical protein LBS40_05375 [Burkholderiales bacterium]|nr:hypothetical protein [Burkholderiales bacterium]
MLRQQAAHGTEQRIFYESATWSLIVIALFCVFCFAVGLYKIEDDALKGMLSIALGIGLGWLTIRLFLRLKKPFLKLNADGFSFSDFAVDIPWIVVEQYRVATRDVYAVTSTTEIIFTFVKEYELPGFTPDSRIKYRREDKSLYISITDLRKPLTAALLSHEIDIHWRGGLARHALDKSTDHLTKKV